MKIGKGLAIVGLFSLAAVMLHYEVDPLGIGLFIIISLFIICDS